MIGGVLHKYEIGQRPDDLATAKRDKHSLSSRRNEMMNIVPKWLAKALRARRRSPGSVRILITVPTFIVVAVIAGVIVGTSSKVPVISGFVGAYLASVVTEVVWVRKHRDGADAHAKD